MRQQRPRRAVMYVPGHDEKKLKKISSLSADCVLLDCEDGVGFDKKDEARSSIVNQYANISKNYHQEVGIRINSPSSTLACEDIKAIFSMEVLPQCVVVPKIDTYDEMRWVCNEINEACQAVRPGNWKKEELIDIIFMCESARGLVHLQKIIEAGIVSTCVKRNLQRSQLSGVIFGSDDFCADMEIDRSSGGTELMYARQKLATTAKAYDLQAIDMVYIDYKDTEGLKAQSIAGSSMGFTGKQVIHPAQVDVVQESFSPSQQRFEWAQELLKAFSESDNKGVFTFRGQMIDMPTILQAKNIVRLSERFNK